MLVLSLCAGTATLWPVAGFAWVPSGIDSKTRNSRLADSTLGWNLKIVGFGYVSDSDASFCLLVSGQETPFEASENIG